MLSIKERENRIFFLPDKKNFFTDSHIYLMLLKYYKKIYKILTQVQIKLKNLNSIAL